MLSPVAKLYTLGCCVFWLTLERHPLSDPQLVSCAGQLGPSAGLDAKLHRGGFEMPEKPEEVEDALQDIKAALERIDRALDGRPFREDRRSWILRELIQGYIETDIVEENEES